MTIHVLCRHTLSVRIETNVHDEYPEIDDGSNVRPTPTLIITVSDLN